MMYAPGQKNLSDLFVCAVVQWGRLTVGMGVLSQSTSRVSAHARVINEELTRKPKQPTSVHGARYV